MIERARDPLVIGWLGRDLRARVGIRYWRFPITQYMWPSSRLRTAHPTKYSFIGNACSLIYALRLLILVRFEAAWQSSSAVNISQQAIKWFLSFHSLNVDWVPLRLRRRLLILHSTRQLTHAAQGLDIQQCCWVMSGSDSNRFSLTHICWIWLCLPLSNNCRSYSCDTINIRGIACTFLSRKPHIM